MEGCFFNDNYIMQNASSLYKFEFNFKIDFNVILNLFNIYNNIKM